MSDTLKPSAVPPQPASADSDRVPLPQKAAYGLGVVADHHAMLGITMFALPFYSDALGIAPTVIGTILLLARFWDAITDPLVGSKSDNWKSKIGRRKPFIFVGAILTGLFYPVIWQVPEAWGENATIAFFCVSLLIFYTFYSIFSVPYESLGTELTPSYTERTSVFVVRSYVLQAFSVGMSWYLYLATLIGTMIIGVRYLSFGIALMIVAMGILPAIFCVERYKKVAEKQESVKFSTFLKSLFKSPPLLIVISTVAIYLLAVMSGAQMSYYINTYYLFDGDVQAGAKIGGFDGTIRIAFSLLGAFVVQRLSQRVDKHIMMLASVAILFLSFAGMYFTITPSNPYLSLATKPLLAFAEAGFWILIISMKADVCDWDEWTFGKRREGMISASVNWFVKLSVALSMWLGTFVLEHGVGYEHELKADQAPGVMDNMLLAYVLIPCISLAVVFILLLKYPLTRKRMREIRDDLETRRDAV